LIHKQVARHRGHGGQYARVFNPLRAQALDHLSTLAFGVQA